MTIISRMTETSHLPGQRPGEGSPKSIAPRQARLDLLRDRLLEAIAPLGYEDDLGFHYGQPPEQRDRVV